jgi:hypothetical protein
MSMKSMTMIPPMSRSRSWWAIWPRLEAVLEHGLLEVGVADEPAGAGYRSP